MGSKLLGEHKEKADRICGLFFLYLLCRIYGNTAPRSGRGKCACALISERSERVVRFKSNKGSQRKRPPIGGLFCCFFVRFYAKAPSPSEARKRGNLRSKLAANIVSGRLVQGLFAFLGVKNTPLFTITPSLEPFGLEPASFKKSLKRRYLCDTIKIKKGGGVF